MNGGRLLASWHYQHRSVRAMSVGKQEAMKPAETMHTQCLSMPFTRLPFLPKGAPIGQVWPTLAAAIPHLFPRSHCPHHLEYINVRTQNTAWTQKSPSTCSAPCASGVPGARHAQEHVTFDTVGIDVPIH